jgi:hypothetical protein
MGAGGDESKRRKVQCIVGARCEIEGEMGKMIASLEDSHHIAEAFSPPRVVEMAREMGLQGGWSLDIATVDEKGNPWELSVPEMRDKARR